MSIEERVGQNIRRMRLAAGLSQWQLAAILESEAEEFGIDQAYISHLENGRKNPSLRTLWVIARALRVPVADLLREE